MWRQSNDGFYSIWVLSTQVKDTSGNAVPRTMVGTFGVRIADARASAKSAKPHALPAARKNRDDVLA